MDTLTTFWRSFKRQPMGLIGLVMLIIIILVALLAPLLAPYDPKAAVRVTLDDIYAPPNAEHWLGTDDAGKDVLTNLIYGSRVSLTVGFFAAFISLIIGGLIGIVAGFYGGQVENFLMRLTDILLVIPDLPLMIILIAILGRSLSIIIVVLGILGWTSTARVVRSQTLSVKERKFVQRARAIGAGNMYIVRRHIFPLVFPLMVVNAVITISVAIYNESVLAFLGLGDPTRLSWGQMLQFAFTRGGMSAGAWWSIMPPGLAIVWVVLALTLLGNGLERVFNPRLELHHLSVGPKMVARPAQTDSRETAPVPAGK
ncbi:MAG: ABC transporter permease [Anaerolineae bacterium]|nr:ABC transporter permease [Anaerolineae bacterium]